MKSYRKKPRGTDISSDSFENTEQQTVFFSQRKSPRKGGIRLSGMGTRADNEPSEGNSTFSQPFQSVLEQNNKSHDITDSVLQASTLPMTLNPPKMLIDVEVKYSEGRGRGIFANKIIDPGEIILKDCAFAAVLDDRNLSNHCSACFKIGKLQRCAGCQVIYYCNMECQRLDWKIGHKEECKAFIRLRRPIPTAIRLICRMLWRRKHEPTLWVDVESLKHHRSEISSSRLETFAQMSMVVKDCVGDEVFLRMSDMIDLFCRFISNSFSILDGELHDIGVGVFTLTALANHSCLPNCVVIFEGDRSIVRSTKKILTGEEITIAYIDSAEPIIRRRQELKDRYFFQCRCSLCELSENTVDLREAWRCHFDNCDGAIPPPDPLEFSEEYQVYCSQCGKNSTIESGRAYEDLERANKLLELLKDVNPQSIDQRLKSFNSAVILQSGHLHLANFTLIQTKQSIKELYVEINDWRSAFNISKQLTQAYKLIYPPKHPLIGIELYTSAQLLLLWEENLAEAICLLKEALEIVYVSHGKEHYFTNLVKDRLFELDREYFIRIKDGVN